LHPDKDIAQALNKPWRRTIIRKAYKPLKRTKIVSTANTKQKRKTMKELDFATYFAVFASKPHKCEECDKPLPSVFKDKEGNINAIFQFSHILTKSAFPEFRHDSRNFNRLCFEHHQQWEFGDRKTMRIYEPNQLVIEQLREFNNDI
jgi:hypothetical protein